jgi:hypothetical protein
MHHTHTAYIVYCFSHEFVAVVTTTDCSFEDSEADSTLC